MSRLWFCALLTLAACGLSSPAGAQDTQPIAHVAYADGRVFVDHDDASDEATGNVPLEPGDRVRAEDGRAEVLFADGTVLQLDEQTTVDIESDSLVRLMNGRVIIVGARNGQLQVDTPAGSAFVDGAGEYRVGVLEDSGRPTLDLAVVRGRAEIASDVERLAVDTGQRSWARLGEAPSYPVAFNSAERDAFYDWSNDRLAAMRGTTAVQYVPASLRSYAGTFDAYGSWGYEQPYGHVWYPRVAVGWRPYYAGRWRHYGRFGWTWIGGDPWAWPTHHYGRWGISTSGAWFWIPGSVWAGAWVDWAFDTDYVSWCPLGWNNRPVFAFWTSWGRDRYYGRGYYRSRDDCWRGWTVLPRGHFGTRYAVSRYSIDGRGLFGRGRDRRFDEHRPPPRPYAVSRAGGSRFAARRDDGRVFHADRGALATRRGMAAPRGGYADRGVSADRRFGTVGGSRGDGAIGRERQGARAFGSAVPRASGDPVRRGGTITSYENGRARTWRVPPAAAGTASGEGRGVIGGGRTPPPARYGAGYAVPRGDQGGRTWSAGRGIESRTDRYGTPPTGRSSGIVPGSGVTPGWSGRSGGYSGPRTGTVAPAQPRSNSGRFGTYQGGSAVPRGSYGAAPRYDRPSAPSYRAMPRYEAPAPRSYQPPSQRYESPRGYRSPSAGAAAPRYERPSPSFRSAPAPRYERPSAPSYSGGGSRSSSGRAMPSPRGGGGGSSRGAVSRGGGSSHSSGGHRRR